MRLTPWSAGTLIGWDVLSQLHLSAGNTSYMTIRRQDGTLYEY